MNGNIALSMEIGSAYALQVCLLQIPTLVLFSAIHGRWIDPTDTINYTFSKCLPPPDSPILANSDISTNLSTMGYGYCYSVHFLVKLHVRRRQEQLLQRLHLDLGLLRCYFGILVCLL